MPASADMSLGGTLGALEGFQYRDQTYTFKGSFWLLHGGQSDLGRGPGPGWRRGDR